MSTVRFGVVGIGNMGSAHCRSLLEGRVPRASLGAVCDLDPAKVGRFPQVPGFADIGTMLRSGTVDAVLVATPHYDHVTIGSAALEAGFHVMVEKPLAVHPLDAERLVAAWKGREDRQVFGLMFNQRTDHYYQAIRRLVRGGELGQVRRIQWTITNWFRSQAYYDSGGWRATWAGEGGGVLLNQCPHNIDLFQWMFGMPKRVHAWCSLGRYHSIEVEDDVTAYFEYEDGTTATFLTSTGESPGTNRLEVATDRGRLVYENDRILFTRTEIPVPEFSRTTDQAFGSPNVWHVEVPARGHGGQHNEVLRNFVDAILDKTPLLAPAIEGVHGVQLACAMLYSSFLGRTVELPIDSADYAARLAALAAGSRGAKQPVREVKTDLSASFR